MKTNKTSLLLLSAQFIEARDPPMFQGDFQAGQKTIHSPFWEVVNKNPAISSKSPSLINNWSSVLLLLLRGGLCFTGGALMCRYLCTFSLFSKALAGAGSVFFMAEHWPLMKISYKQLLIFTGIIFVINFGILCLPGILIISKPVLISIVITGAITLSRWYFYSDSNAEKPIKLDIFLLVEALVYPALYLISPLWIYMGWQGSLLFLPMRFFTQLSPQTINNLIILLACVLSGMTWYLHSDTIIVSGSSENRHSLLKIGANGPTFAIKYADLYAQRMVAIRALQAYMEFSRAVPPLEDMKYNATLPLASEDESALTAIVFEAPPSGESLPKNFNKLIKWKLLGQSANPHSIGQSIEKATNSFDEIKKLIIDIDLENPPQSDDKIEENIKDIAKIIGYCIVLAVPLIYKPKGPTEEKRMSQIKKDALSLIGKLTNETSNKIEIDKHQDLLTLSSFIRLQNLSGDKVKLTALLEYYVLCKHKPRRVNHTNNEIKALDDAMAKLSIGNVKAFQQLQTASQSILSLVQNYNINDLKQKDKGRVLEEFKILQSIGEMDNLVPTSSSLSLGWFIQCSHTIKTINDNITETSKLTRKLLPKYRVIDKYKDIFDLKKDKDGIVKAFQTFLGIKGEERVMVREHFKQIKALKIAFTQECMQWIGFPELFTKNNEKNAASHYAHDQSPQEVKFMFSGSSTTPDIQALYSSMQRSGSYRTVCDNLGKLESISIDNVVELLPNKPHLLPAILWKMQEDPNLKHLHSKAQDALDIIFK